MRRLPWESVSLSEARPAGDEKVLIWEIVELASHARQIIPIRVQPKMKPATLSLLALFLVACSDVGPDVRVEMPTATARPTATSTGTLEPTHVPIPTTAIGSTNPPTMASAPNSRPEPSPTQTPRPTPSAEEIILDTVVSCPKAMVSANWDWKTALSFDEISVTVDIHSDIECGGDRRQLYLPVLLPHQKMLPSFSRLLIDAHRSNVNRLSRLSPSGVLPDSTEPTAANAD